MDAVMATIRVLGPIFALVWLLTLSMVVWRPQQYFNSILLMLALLVSMIFFAGLFGDWAGYVLLVFFLLVLLALLLAPVLLILNGIHMIRRESFSPAHLLSLGLGVLIAVGELAGVIYVLDLAETLGMGDANVWFLLLSFTVFYFSFLVLSFVVYSVFIQHIPHWMQFDYVIIHGCGLSDGRRMTKLLSNRVDKAVKIYKRCRKKPYIIPSGGKGPDEKLSEAQAMKQYLLRSGIPEDHILPENRSATTRENLLNSMAVIEAHGGGKRIALVSSNYHIYRCLRLARELGIKCIGIGADVALYYWPSALIREFIAVFVTKRFLLWSLGGYLVFVSPLLWLLLR